MFATEDHIFHHYVQYPLYSYYYCGSEFIKLPKHPSGPKTLILVFEYGHCTIGELIGETFQILREIKTFFPKKQRAGGQSAPRFDRLRLEAQKQFNKKIKEEISQFTYDRLIVGGPGLSKSIWEQKKIVHADLIFGCQYNGFSGIREIWQKVRSFK